MTKSISPQMVGRTLCVILLGVLISGGIFLANHKPSDAPTALDARPEIDPNDSTAVEMGATLQRLETFRQGLDKVDGAREPSPASPNAPQTPDEP